MTFDDEMRRLFDESCDIGYRPTRFLIMLRENGGVETARRLLDNPYPSEGFTKLLLLGRLDLTVEYLVTQPQWSGLFDPVLVQRAQERLA